VVLELPPLLFNVEMPSEVGKGAGQPLKELAEK
jgi:hypothetical protein